jgi:tRNA(Ile)-lysidine synthase
MAPEPPTSDFGMFGRRLNGPAGAPVAVALSGGGDSLALLHLAKAWADRAGRRLVALTVDHGLQPASAAWTGFAAERALSLGVAHRALAWTGHKPAHGLPAAARAARHALLAEAARTAGARVLLMGHTADDLVEAEEMRRMGAAVPSPRFWSPSPAWPEGRGVFLLRPLLERRRADLRRLLQGLGESWIEDPANDDLRFARAVARRRLAGQAVVPPPPLDPAPWPGLAEVRCGPGGELVLARGRLAGPGGDDVARAMGALAVCAAGGRKTPSAVQLARLRARLASPGDFVAALAGARIEARGEQLLFCREAGEHRRIGLATAPLPRGESVFDGRFLVVAGATGWRIAPLRGLASRLSRPARARLAELPAPVRAALPAAISPAGEVVCPALDDAGPVAAHSLTRQRLCATLGAFADEAALWRVANLPSAT